MRDRVCLLAGILAGERQPLLVGGRVQADLKRGGAKVRKERNEDRPRVLDRLSRLPLARGNRRHVIVRPDQLFVRVDEVHHDAIVFGELRIVGDDELVGDVEWTAGRRPVVAQRDARRRKRRKRRSFLAAADDGGCRDQNTKTEDGQAAHGSGVGRRMVPDLSLTAQWSAAVCYSFRAGRTAACRRKRWDWSKQ